MRANNLAHIRDQYELSEDETALRFTAYHRDLLWCQVWGKWLVWDGNAWKFDETVHVFDLIRIFCRSGSKTIGKTDADRRRAQSASFVAAVEKLCRSDRKYAAVADQFDADDWVLNTPSGIIDLRSGTVAEPEPTHYCTRMTAVEPDGDCLRWREFLSEVTDCDDELIDYLQRMIGYCLTGSTREHSLHFLYGTGGNGKTVFLDTIIGLMGDYAKSAPMETFTESRNDRHPTELAMLQGARLVVAQETEQGKRWAQSRIKALTGGDKVVARYMRQDFFEYKPKFKLLVAGNTKPKLDTVDEAMRRRFHIVPFTVQIAPNKRDRDLIEKLQLEWPGIMAWAVEGCLQYQEKGLAPPASVIEATRAYLESQDVFREWLDTECTLGQDKWERPTMLFNSWRRFAEASRERVGERSVFKERLEAAGFQQRRDGIKGRYWMGIEVKPIEQKWDV